LTWLECPFKFTDRRYHTVGGNKWIDQDSARAGYSKINTPRKDIDMGIPQNKDEVVGLSAALMLNKNVLSNCPPLVG
jgi:hypothetical protein